jgi:hypothetical protein
MNEFSRLKKIVVIKAIASTLEQPAIGGQDEHLLARTVLASLPESLILISYNQVIISIVLLTRVRFLLLVLLKLHVCQCLCQIKMYLIDVFDCIRELCLLFFRVELIHCIKHQMKKLIIVGCINTGAAGWL